MTWSTHHRRLLRVLAVTSCALVLWAGSLLLDVTRFGASATVTVQQGFIGVYWGGDSLSRNSALDNHFSAPWAPGHGAGRALPDGVIWVVRGPGKIPRPSEWADAIQSGSFFNSVLGLWRPSLQFGSGAGHVILPTWVLVLLGSATTALLWYRGRVRSRGTCCMKCGYDLTGNVSGVCPECGKVV